MADKGDRRGAQSCDERCGCPSPCPGGHSCRCTAGEAMSMSGGHQRCSCGEHCGCNPCHCGKSEAAGVGKAGCKCGAGCGCSACAS